MGVLRSRTRDAQTVLSAVHVVGRMQSCNLPLTSGFVSTAHALIRWDGHAWSIRDLGSRNGTFVNEVPITKGEEIALRRGARIAFGGPGEAWELTNADQPEAVVVPLDGGAPIPLSRSVTGIPTKAEPLATIYLDRGIWLLEHEESRRPLESGALFVVAGQAFRFDCPSAVAPTTEATARGWMLADADLFLSVPRNEEAVSLTVKSGERTLNLGQRASFYLLLVLARERLRQPSRGVERGWVAVDDLLRMIPEYTSHMHFNVEIFRLRRLLSGAGFIDAAAIIERRRGEVRVGTSRIEIRPGSVGPLDPVDPVHPLDRPG